MPTDAYEIRAGYPHWSETKNVTVFNQAMTACIFTPQFGALHLTCNHEGATYLMKDANGQYVDNGNLPAVVGGLPPGSYQMTATYRDHHTQQSAMVAAGVTNEAKFEFVAGRGAN